jgi:hypothetical protein
VNLYSCTAAESLRVYSTLQPPCLDRPVVVCPASSSASQLFGLGLHRGHSIRQLVVAYVTPTVPPRVSFLPAHRVHHCPLFSRSRRIDFSVSPLPPPHIAAAIVLRVPPRGRSAGALSSEAGGVACLPMLVGSANICSTDEVCRSVAASSSRPGAAAPVSGWPGGGCGVQPFWRDRVIHCLENEEPMAAMLLPSAEDSPPLGLSPFGSSDWGAAQGARSDSESEGRARPSTARSVPSPLALSTPRSYWSDRLPFGSSVKWLDRA